MNFQLEAGEVRLTITDNGRGLPPDARTEEMDGVANMRSRLEKLGGRFEVTGQPGHGIDDPTFLQPDRPMSAIGG